MALTEIYVDPSIAGDSGAGTVGDPYGDLEYAIEQETFDTTNGTRVNIKAGTAEVLAASLENALDDTSVSVAWAPIETAPFILQGYTTAADDGGVGVINTATSIINANTKDNIHLKDLSLVTTAGTSNTVVLDDFCSVIKCEISGPSTGSGISLDNDCVVSGCYVHHTASPTKFGIRADSNSIIEHCYVENTGLAQGIFSFGARVRNCIVTFTGVDDGAGIYMGGAGTVEHNSVYAGAAHTGSGIHLAANVYGISISNNLVEGFSGSGGFGIEFLSETSLSCYGGNAVYDCETAYTAGGPTEYAVDNRGDNETLTASPFTSASTGDFAPVDTGNVKEGALPQIIGGGLV